MKIYLATAADTEEILQIYSWYISNTIFSFELEVPSIHEYQQRIEKYGKAAPWLVAKKENEIIGFAYASPHRGRAAYQWNREVSVYVKDNYHGKGIAQQLYSTLFELLKVQGYANVLAGIVYPNAKSVKFHKKMGFQLVGRYRNIGHKFGAWRHVEWYELFLQTPNYVPSNILSIAALKASPIFQSKIHS